MKPIIEIKGLGKRYDIMHQRGRYIALRDVLANVFKRPFSFLRSKARKAVGLEKREEFWALRNVSFDVMPGEVIGIIGKNGAGKSTLLKILTGITPPTEGEAIMRGRVSSLLEVGTGFHPELTGRENIFLNAAILGMTRKEIARKFDEIVAFSGVEKFLDTPVKHYSSGMQVRLAFSIAAHIEPDILIVDEVLAVGDAEFQKKSMGKMEEVTSQDGRTILFVSHNMEAIERLCTRTVWIDHGEIKQFGPTKEVVNDYLNRERGKNIAMYDFPFHEGSNMQITKISIRDEDGEPSADLDMLAPFTIEVEFEVREAVDGAILSLLMFTNEDQMLLLSDPFDYTNTYIESFAPGKYRTRVRVPARLFNVGDYYFNAILHMPMATILDRKKRVQFSIHDSGSLKGRMYNQTYQGALAVPLLHETEKVG